MYKSDNVPIVEKSQKWKDSPQLCKVSQNTKFNFKKRKMNFRKLI